MNFMTEEATRNEDAPEAPERLNKGTEVFLSIAWKEFFKPHQRANIFARILHWLGSMVMSQPMT